MSTISRSGLNYLVEKNLNNLDIYKSSTDQDLIKDQILNYITSAMNNLSTFYKMGLIFLLIISHILTLLGCGFFLFKFFPFTTLNRFVRGLIFLRIFELIPVEAQLVSR